MRAVRVTRLDGPGAVEIADVPEPNSEGRVLIEAQAAGLTFPDVLLTRGLYQMKPDPPFTPGAQAAGVVRSAPEGSGFSAGDRVTAIPGLGGMAELVAAEPRSVFKLPGSIDFETAAAIPMNYFTVHFALKRRGRLKAGETVLVHGAAGGIGTAAIQFAKALGARVVAVVSTDFKAEVAREVGADETVLAENFKDGVRSLTDGRGVDVVVDPVGGGDRFTDSLRSLAPEGRALVIGFTAGEIPTVRVNRLLLNNIEVVGVGWGAFIAFNPGHLAEQWAEIAPLLESGALRPRLGRVYALEQAAEALADIDERRATGNIVLRTR